MINKRRLVRWGSDCSRWLRMRSKDLSWLWGGHEFRRQLPVLQQRHEWIFIVGCNNSGTTLIHDVLAATGQFSFLDHEGQRYTDSLNGGHRRGYERVWTEFLDDLRLVQADPADRAERLIFDWLREIGGPVKPRVLEKTTVNAVRMRWLQEIFQRSAFIAVVRSGYAVAEGIKRKGNKPVWRGARHWQRVNEVILEDSKYLKRFLLVRYEDFVGAPKVALPRISSFLDMPIESLESAFEKISRSSADGARMAIQDMNETSIRRLSEKELGIISQHAGAMLTQLGYGRDSAV